MSDYILCLRSNDKKLHRVYISHKEIDSLADEYFNENLRNRYTSSVRDHNDLYKYRTVLLVISGHHAGFHSNSHHIDQTQFAQNIRNFISIPRYYQIIIFKTDAKNNYMPLSSTDEFLQHLPKKFFSDDLREWIENEAIDNT